MADLKGFTIVELMIAAIVFSLVMLAALTGFMLVGRIFYQGVSMTQTQNAAQKIVNDVTSNLNSASNVSSLNSDNKNGFAYYCVGNARYTYLVNSSGAPLRDVVNLTSPVYKSPSQGGNFGLLKDILPGGAPCASPASGFYQPTTEMLGSDMRLSNLSITPSGSGLSGLYDINVTVAYGTQLNNPAQSDPTCKGGNSNSQFCAVVSLATSAYEGISL